MFFHEKSHPEFVVNKVGGQSTTEMESLDIFFNWTTTKMQLIQGNVPWRGPQEKDLGSLKFLIEVLIKPGDVVLDAYAFMGKSHFLT